MKNRWIVLVMFAFLLIGTSGYSQYFKEKDQVINLGIGIGSALYGTGNTVSFPPLAASYEYGLKEGVGPGVVGIGGYLGIAASRSELYKYTYTAIGVRGTYHVVDIADKLDLYGGLMLYYAIFGSKWYGGPEVIKYKADASHAAASIFVGARYYLSEQFALMGEIGYGFSTLSLGVAYKFNLNKQ